MCSNSSEIWLRLDQDDDYILASECVAEGDVLRMALDGEIEDLEHVFQLIDGLHERHDLPILVEVVLRAPQHLLVVDDRRGAGVGGRAPDVAQDRPHTLVRVSEQLLLLVAVRRSDAEFAVVQNAEEGDDQVLQPLITVQQKLIHLKEEPQSVTHLNVQREEGTYFDLVERLIKLLVGVLQPRVRVLVDLLSARIQPTKLLVLVALDQLTRVLVVVIRFRLEK